MIDEAVAVEIGERVVAQPVMVEVHPDRFEAAVTVEVEVGLAVPDRRRAIITSQAVVHD